MPFENSTFGAVESTLDLLADKGQEFRRLHVFGEIFLNIDHCLVGFGSGSSGNLSVPGDATPTLDLPNPPKPKSHPLMDISHIKCLHSHAQAFGQCNAFISTYLKGVELHEVGSTSKGAETVAKSGEVATAAIASKAAAQAHNLTILAKCIQDRDDNQTRFLVLVHGYNIQLPRNPNFPIPGYLISHPIPSWNEKRKGLICFVIDHNRPGALADALSIFKLNNLNLTSANSRPNGKALWQYIFFVEFEGLGEQNVTTNTERALSHLQSCVMYYRFYGTWKDMNAGA